MTMLRGPERERARQALTNEGYVRSRQKWQGEIPKEFEWRMMHEKQTRVGL